MNYRKLALTSLRSIACSLVFFFTLTFGGVVCAEDTPEDINLAQDVSPASDEEVVESGLWPFIVFEKTPSWRQSAFRPFYVERETTDGLEKEVHFLWPIYSYRRSDEDVSIRVVPVYTYWKDVYACEDTYEYKSQYMLFPFVFGGTSTEYGKYFALFPIGGTTKHFLGQDEIRFVLFPLYMEYSNDELRQRNYLWPILSFSEGGGYDGFRVWPFYGRFEKSGEYRKKFVLWPFYNYQEFDLHKEQSGERLFFFPFYAREDSARRRYRSVLWPFFSSEQNYARNFEERSTPWPFVVISRGDIYRTQFWPLYGFRKTDERESRFVLWPFWYRRLYELDEDLRRHETWLLPIWFSKTDVAESEEVITHRVRCWPLYRFRRFEDDSTRFKMLSLLWFDDESGFERQYSPLWTIYERETSPDGTGHTYALWRLYRHSFTPTGSETRVPLLFSQRKDSDEGFEETRILGGLLGTKRQDEERTLRLLYFIEVPY